MRTDAFTATPGDMPIHRRMARSKSTRTRRQNCAKNFDEGGICRGRFISVRRATCSSPSARCSISHSRCCMCSSSIKFEFPSLTKGRIPAEHMVLLQAHAALVEAQVGLITLEESVHSLFEPKAALPAGRLEQMAKLVAAGIATSGRLDPILPGVTDSDHCLRQICSAVARTGITRLAAGTLFLRSAVVSSLRRNLRNSPILKPLLEAFAQGHPLVLRGGESSIRALSADARRAIFQRVQDIGAQFGLTMVGSCACKNPDIAAGSCQIAGQRVARDQSHKQLDLFRGECLE